MDGDPESLFHTDRTSKTVLDSWVPRRGLIASFWAGRTGAVGHGLAVLNPLTAPLTHVVGTLEPQLTVLVVGLIWAVEFTTAVGASLL